MSFGVHLGCVSYTMYYYTAERSGREASCYWPTYPKISTIIFIFIFRPTDPIFEIFFEKPMNKITMA